MEAYIIFRFILITFSITVCKTSKDVYNNGGNGGTHSAQHKSGSIHKFTGGYTGGVIPAAIQTTRNVEVRPVDLPSDPIQPAVVLVDAGVIPLTILFRSSSSALTVMQQHNPGQVGEQQHTKSEDEPHRLLHEVTKPIIQEVREYITPFRRVVQEIQPVQEDIHTIVARGQQIATGAHQYNNNGNKYGTPGGAYGKTNSNNFDFNFNLQSGSSNLKTDNPDKFIKPQTSFNLNEQSGIPQLKTDNHDQFIRPSVFNFNEQSRIPELKIDNHDQSIKPPISFNFNEQSGRSNLKTDNHDQSIKSSVFNFNEQSRSSQLKTDKPDQFVRPTSFNFNQYGQKRTSSYGKAWNSGSGFDSLKTKVFATNKETNNGSEKSSKWPSTNYTNQRSVNSHVQATKGSVQTQNNQDKQSQINGIESAVKNVQEQSSLPSESTSEKPTTLKETHNTPEVISKTNHGPPKPSGPKKPLASPVKNLRAKSLQKKQQKTE